MSGAKAPAAKKKKGFNIVLLLVPIALIAALVLAYTLPPTHAMIVNSPLKPLLAKIGLASSANSALAVKDKAADPQVEIKRLSGQVETDRKTAVDKDARITQLQSEVAGLKAPVAEPSPTSLVNPSPSPTPVPADVKRAATYWAGMDAEKAADVAQKLPPAYVQAVFSQMPADAVAEIMNALPAKIAAKLTASTPTGAEQP